MGDTKENQKNIIKEWNDFLQQLKTFILEFNTFKISRCKENSLFALWNNFISSIVPVLPDLTKSFQDADWDLHFSWVRCAIYMFLSLSCVSYKRWLALHYENSLALLERFPVMYGRFVNGEFVVSHSLRKDSVAPMEQALRKTVSKPSKWSSNHFFAKGRSLPYIKHQKTEYKNFLFHTFQMGKDDMYNLHYEFSKRITAPGQKGATSTLRKNILKRGNPFDTEE